ncbi:MAG: hypothetical protein AAGA75_23220 [Cyanobacteria bacterium P01_E01_bin.6]
MSDRLNRIEENLENATQLLAAAASHAESAHERLNQAGRRIDQLAAQQHSNELALANVVHNVDRLTTQVSEYVNEAREDRKSLHAAIDRMERLMDYLIRKDEG